MSYESQLLIELETKRDAIQNRLDFMLSEGYFQYEIEPIEREWERLMDKINDLKKELSA